MVMVAKGVGSRRFRSGRGPENIVHSKGLEPNPLRRGGSVTVSDGRHTGAWIIESVGMKAGVRVAVLRPASSNSAWVQALRPHGGTCTIPASIVYADEGLMPGAQNHEFAGGRWHRTHRP